MKRLFKILLPLLLILKACDPAYAVQVDNRFIQDGAITGSKITLPNGKIFIGNGSNAAVASPVVGDLSIDSSGNSTLSTVNSNVGLFTSANITVNAKGLITAAANGSGGGGGSVTSQVVADMSVQANSSDTLPLALTNMNIITIGDNAIMLGGQTNPVASTGTANIYTSTLSSDPLNFTLSGNTLPAARWGGHLFRTGTDLYYVGGFDSGGTGQRTIYHSTTSAPTVWTDTLALLPSGEGRGAGAFGIVGSKAYIWGGYQKSSIVSANISSMTSWSTESNSLPAIRGYSHFYEVGNSLYLAAGDQGGNSINTIIKADKSDPTTWASSGTFPASIENGTVAIIQDRVFIFGINTSQGAAISTIYSAQVGTPTTFTSYATSQATTSTGVGGFLYNGLNFMVGGCSNFSTNSALTTEQKTTQFITVNQPTFSGVSSLLGGPSFDNGGQQWILSTFNKLGFAPWTYDATIPF